MQVTALDELLVCGEQCLRLLGFHIVKQDFTIIAVLFFKEQLGALRVSCSEPVRSDVECFCAVDPRVQVRCRGAVVAGYRSKKTRDPSVETAWLLLAFPCDSAPSAMCAPQLPIPTFAWSDGRWNIHIYPHR